MKNPKRKSPTQVVKSKADQETEERNTEAETQNQDQYLTKKIRELNVLEKRLATLKKGVAAFCLFIVLLNIYHINRLGTVSTDLDGLMLKYTETVSRMDNIRDK